MKIDLPVQCFGHWEVVKAEIVDIAPHLPGSFAVHPTDGFDLFGWKVTNIETGAWVGTGKTRAAAIQHAKERCAKATPGSYWRAAYKCAAYRKKAYGVDIING